MRAQGTVGRPAMKELRDDCRKIGALLASGFNPDDIRHELKLTKRQYKYRVALMRTRAYDHADVFPKFMARVEVRYRQLEAIRQRAVQMNKLDTALRAIEDMKRLDREIIEVGQDLGIYEQQHRKVDITITAPTLGLFHEARKTIDVTPEDPDKYDGSPKKTPPRISYENLTGADEFD